MIARRRAPSRSAASPLDLWPDVIRSTEMRMVLLAAATGIVLGFLGSKLLFLGWLTVIPWGLAALLVGYLALNRRQALFAGVVFGFFLGFVFMIGGYSGSDPLLSKLLPFALIGVVTAAVGAIAAVIGSFARQLVHRGLT